MLFLKMATSSVEARNSDEVTRIAMTYDGMGSLNWLDYMIPALQNFSGPES